MLDEQNQCDDICNVQNIKLPLIERQCTQYSMTIIRIPVLTDHGIRFRLVKQNHIPQQSFVKKCVKINYFRTSGMSFPQVHPSGLLHGRLEILIFDISPVCGFGNIRVPISVFRNEEKVFVLKA